MGDADRAQAAVEYLMTYGWAVLVVMVVGIFMWQTGMFNSTVSTATSNGFPKLKPQLGGTGLTAAGDFSGTFVNGVGSKIIISNVEVHDMGTGAVICCSHSVAGPCNGRNNAVDVGGRAAADFTAGTYPRVGSGENFAVHLNSCVVPGAAAGSTYAIQVEMIYEVANNRVSVNHTESGQLKGMLE
jgi:hypothetical protein